MITSSPIKTSVSSPALGLTDLRGGQALLGQLEDLLFDIIGCELQPLQGKATRSSRVHNLRAKSQTGILTVGTLRRYGRADWDRPFLSGGHTHSHG